MAVKQRSVLKQSEKERTPSAAVFCVGRARAARRRARERRRSPFCRLGATHRNGVTHARDVPLRRSLHADGISALSQQRDRFLAPRLASSCTCLCVSH
eukprot:1737322-Pleurochrysis_carterae.AAC.1